MAAVRRDAVLQDLVHVKMISMMTSMLQMIIGDPSEAPNTSIDMIRVNGTNSRGEDMSASTTWTRASHDFSPGMTSKWGPGRRFDDVVVDI